MYVIAGGFSALTGIVLSGYAGQATLGAGDPYLFASIAAAVIGVRQSWAAEGTTSARSRGR